MGDMWYDPIPFLHVFQSEQPMSVYLLSLLAILDQQIATEVFVNILSL